MHTYRAASVLCCTYTRTRHRSRACPGSQTDKAARQTCSTMSAHSLWPFAVGQTEYRCAASRSAIAPGPAGRAWRVQRGAARAEAPQRPGACTAPRCLRVQCLRGRVSGCWWFEGDICIVYVYVYVYVCMYVCMFVCMYVCMYAHTYTCVYAQHERKLAPAHTRTHTSATKRTLAYTSASATTSAHPARARTRRLCARACTLAWNGRHVDGCAGRQQGAVVLDARRQPRGRLD